MNSRSAPAIAARRLAVVGTAGHIDHGKTALVRRLTGVDTDRLPEEKQRGISIDLGFAPLVTPGGIHVGLVDVPGHERFVKNMLAGVGGIDLVLLVIAADEGVMPQTREHLAIVRLLGISRGVVVLTKRDLVEPDWVELVKRDVRALLSGTALAQAPIVEFSAVTGEGTETLLAELDRQLGALANRSADEPARLPVDRVFTVEGFGTVVTGTLWRGRVAPGDLLELLPTGIELRVRRVQVHGRTVEAALAGQRTAISLAGVERSAIERGDWLVAPGSLRPSRMLDVRFELLPDYPKAWPADARVRFHLGASEIIGRLVLLEGGGAEGNAAGAGGGAKANGETARRGVLAPGGSALAQLRLERPTVAARGDRFVIRSYSPSRTVGGGVVIEPVAFKRRRRAAGIEQLAVHESGSLEARLIEKLAALDKPTATAALAQSVGGSEGSVGAALAALASSGEIAAPGEGRWLSVARWNAAREAVRGAVGNYVAGHPARFGVMKGELKRDLRATVDAALFDAAFEALVANHVLEQRGEHVRPAGAPWSPPAETIALLERVAAELEAAGYLVPEAPAWQAKLGGAATEVVALGAFLGRLVRVSQELTYTSRQMEELRAKLGAHFARRPSLTVADFRELTGASRKYAVPLLEHADRLGWTMRVGDERKKGAKL